MTNRSKLLIAGALVLALGGTSVALAHKHGHWKGHHGPWAGMGFGGAMHRICQGSVAEKADHLLVRIEHRVKPTDAQKPQFEGLKTAMRDGAAKIQAACPAKPAADTTDEAQKTTVPERLAMAETHLAATLEAVKAVRPAAEAFYQSLNEAQKATLTAMAEPKGHKWRNRDRKGWGGDDDGPSRGYDKLGPEKGPKE